ncbi:MAG TPA: PadR family transcriptional regulator [Rectinemataceae bacterium]|nr:PadR family transcriptional regulator [Rectinemataceae bacterium]
MPKDNRSKYAVLGMVEQKPMSGYDIRKFAAQSVAHFWKEDYSHIYPTLKLLLDEGLVDKREELAEAGPARNVYSINPEGRKALAAWLQEEPNPPNLRIEILLKVFLGAAAKPGSLEPMLERQIQACVESIAQLGAVESHLLEEIERGGKRGRHARFQLMTLRYGKSYYEGFAAWCRAALEELRAPL